MPIGKHYGGHGEEVMANMVKEYGADKAKAIFYATENKKKTAEHVKKARRAHEVARKMKG
jgi:hypothetical protein